MKSNVLILGADSLIGKNLACFCQLNDMPFIATSRRNGKINGKTLYLDLTDRSSQWDNIPAHVDTAVMCAGITSLSVCENNPTLSTAVNIEGTLNLIAKLQQRGIRIIYLSTNQVFDGSRPYETPDRPQNPISVYGFQKTCVEKQLMMESKNGVILRLTKVLAPGTGVLSEWIKSLKQNKPITSFKNMIMAPIHIDQVVRLLFQMIMGHYSGIFHMSGDEDISYADMGYFLAKRLDMSPDVIIPIDADQFLLPKGALPNNTTLDTTRIRDELDIEFKSVWQVMDQVIQEEMLK